MTSAMVSQVSEKNFSDCSNFCTCVEFKDCWVGAYSDCDCTFQTVGKSEVIQSRYTSAVISSVVIVETVLENHLALKLVSRGQGK